MLHRIKYLFFILGIILLALTAPVILFIVQDRLDNQTLHAENQDISVSSILTNNYIEDDAERYTTFLYNQSQGVEYAVMELDSTLSEEDTLNLLSTAFLNEDNEYAIITQDVASVSNTQYAVYNTEDHSDIMFLLTLITIDMYSDLIETSDDGNQYRYDTARILVDSQTGMLYFMGVYYAHNYYEDEDYAKYVSLFLYDTDAAASAFQDDICSRYLIFDMDFSCVDIIAHCVNPFRDVIVEDASYVQAREDSTYVPVEWYYELAREYGFVTGVELTNFKQTTTFPVGFAVRTSHEDSYVSVFCTVQFNMVEKNQPGDFERYQCNLCIGLEEMAFLLPEFNYMKPAVG